MQIDIGVRSKTLLAVAAAPVSINLIGLIERLVVSRPVDKGDRDMCSSTRDCVAMFILTALIALTPLVLFV